MLAAAMDIGGAETHILDLAATLIKNGHAVTLISEGGAFIERAQALGIEWIYAPTKTPSLRSARAVKKAITAQLMRKRYDIVHAHTRYTAAVATSALKNAFVPLVVTAHLCFSLGIKKYFSRWGDRTLAVSDDIREHLARKYAIAEERITTTVNGIDSNRFIEDSRPGKRIIHTSRLDRGRSLCAKLLIGCAERILSSHPCYEIVIVGDGNEFEEIKRLADKANRALGREGIILTGALTEVEPVVRTGDIFVGVSRAALEGGACGLSVVLCGDEGYGGILCEGNFSDMARSNFCARGCEKADEEMLVGDILYLIENEEAKKKNARFLAAKIKAEYSTERMAHDALSTYALAIAEKRPRAAVIGYYGHGNLGDEETLRVIKDVAKKRGIELILPKNDGKSRGIIKRILETGRGIRESQALIFGGGNLLQNETSRRSLVYYCEAIRYAKMRGRKILLLSSGLGEINGALWRRYTMNALAKCDFLGLRTSHDIIEHAALSSHCKGSFAEPRRMPDLCFALPPCSKKKGNFVGIIVSRHGLIDRAAAERICRASGLRARIISIFDKEDRAHAQALAKELGAPIYSASRREDILDILAECRIVVSERLHGAIFSILAKTPVFLDTRRAKCDALVKESALVARRCSAQDVAFPLAEFSAHIGKCSSVTEADFDKITSSLRKDVIKELDRLS